MSFYAIDFARTAAQSRELGTLSDSVRVDVRRFTTFFGDPSGPPADLSGDVLVFGHVRLDEEVELASELGCRGARGLELVARTYAAFAEGFERRLFGDFAIVIVDRERRVVLAVRDPFGVRPLVYRRAGDVLSFARDPIALAASSADLDADAVAEFLGGANSSRERTMFREVSRLPPGHLLRATATSTVVKRHWRPEPVEVEGSASEINERFRALFFSAVGARATGNRPVIAHASGGLDSSAIAAVAARLMPPADLRLAHAHFREADELSWVRALEKHVGRAIAIVDAVPTSTIDDALDPSHPCRYPLAAGANGIAALATSAGARVVLSGIGGDEVTFERGVFRDLAAHRRWIALLRETIFADHYSTRSGRFFFRDALVAQVPKRARALRRRLRARPKDDRPWARAERGAPTEPEPRVFASHTQEATWQWVTSGALSATLELEERAWRRAGLELRVPFLDRRLVEHVLALPFMSRLPHG
ncbi:MAG: asparagine synthase-related protein, partial [Polyangiaceae bacterium]